MLDILHPERIRRCRLSNTERGATGSTQTEHNASIAEQRGQEREAVQRIHEKKRRLESSIVILLVKGSFYTQGQEKLQQVIIEQGWLEALERMHSSTA
jgi:hypothetical protein